MTVFVARRFVALVPALTFAGLAGVACGPAIDRKAVAAVQVSGTNEAPRGCRLLGPLEGRDSDRWVPGGPHYETAMLDLRQKAVLGGGNYLAMDAIIPPRDSDYSPVFLVRARLFACAGPVTVATAAASAVVPPVPSAASANPPHPETPAPARVCEPDCSPGYTCLRGTCVSACNPVCGAGERCGVDRVCHPIASSSAPSPVTP